MACQSVMPMPNGKLSIVFSKGAAAHQKSIATVNVALTNVMAVETAVQN